MQSKFAENLSESLYQKSTKVYDERNTYYEIVWDKEVIMEVIDEITSRGFAIIGGDVINLEKDHMVYTKDCWYYESNLKKKWERNVILSKKKAIKYINNYNKFTGGNPYYAIDFIAFDEILKLKNEN